MTDDIGTIDTKIDTDSIQTRYRLEAGKSRTEVEYFEVSTDMNLARVGVASIKMTSGRRWGRGLGCS